MNCKEAIDFFLEQLVEQAALDHVSLSEFEKRLLRFSETEDAGQEEEEQEEGFESEKESADYETKISGLLKRARKRLRQEDSAEALRWNEALSALEGHDAYILVMLGADPRPRLFGKTFFAVLAISVAVVLLSLGWALIPDRPWQHNPASIRALPRWMPWAIWGLLGAAYIASVFLPRQLNRFADAISELFTRKTQKE